MTLDPAPGSRECPFCKEAINAAAVRCKHCHASIEPTKPEHDGICPFCKEDINPEAIRCKHCKADLVASRRREALIGSPGSQMGRSSGMRRIRRRREHGCRCHNAGLARAGSPGDSVAGVCDGCPAVMEDMDGTWCFIECDADYCTYSPCF